MKYLIALTALFGIALGQGTRTGGMTNTGGTTNTQAGNAISVSSLSVTPNVPGQSQVVNQTIGFSATATLSNGQTIPVTTIANWSISNTAIANFSSLTATQNVMCLSAGTVQITATYNGASSSTGLTCVAVLPPPPTLVSIALTPALPSVAVGQSVPMTATGTFSDGSTQPITATVNWVSGTPANATVGPLTSTEAVNCLKGGTSLITATDPITSIAASTTVTCNAVLTSITVTPANPSIIAGTAIGFIATGSYNDGSKQDVTQTATWSSATPAVASLGALTTQQAVNGLTAGTSVISATLGAISGNTTLTVTNPGPPPPTLSSITVTPANPTVNVNSSLGFKATGHYSDGSTQDVTSQAAWASLTPSVATIQAPSNPQNVLCIANGSSLIQATVGAVSGSTTLTCQTPAPTLVSIAITPSLPTQYQGSTVQFTATGTYSDSSTKDITSSVTWSSGTPAVATIVVNTGLATCVASSGNTLISATLGVSGSTTLTCQPASTNTGGNAYCTPSGTWIGPTTDGPANLPQHCMYTPLSATPAPGPTLGPFSSTTTLQAAINGAACGSKIQVTAGSSIGTITLPAKGCDSAHWIWIESTGVSNINFPAEGTRFTPCWSGVASLPNRPAYPCPSPQVLTFKVTAPNASSAFLVPGGDHYRIIGAEITRVPTGGAAIFFLVSLSTGSLPQTNNIIWDRDWFEGIEPASLPSTSTASDTSTTRAIYLGQSNHIAVIDSYITNMYDTSVFSANGNTDAQCIAGGFGGLANSGWGVYKFVNNHCEASGEGILLGGAGGPPLTPSGCTILVNCNPDAPSDIEIRQNYFFKPPQWNGNTTTPGGSGWPVVKNGFEMKTGIRLLAEGNVIENCWYNAQVCYSFSIAPINQQNGASPPQPTCPTCTVRDFTYRYNYSYNVAYGIGIYAFMGGGCTTCQNQGAFGVSINNNVIGDDLNLGSLTLQSAGDAMQILSAPDSTNRGLNELHNVNISHNTFVKAIRALTIFGGPLAGKPQMINIVAQNNIWPFGNFGFGPINNGANACEGTNGFNDNAYYLLNNCTTSYTWNFNAVFNWNGGVLGSKWPTNGSGLGNFFYTNTSGPGFTNYGTGNSNFNPSNYQLTTASPLHNAGSDGKDLGADIVTLNQKIAGVRQ